MYKRIFLQESRGTRIMSEKEILKWLACYIGEILILHDNKRQIDYLNKMRGCGSFYGY